MFLTVATVTHNALFALPGFGDQNTLAWLYFVAVVEILFLVLVYRTASFAVRSVRDATKGTGVPAGAGQTKPPRFRRPRGRAVSPQARF